MLRWLHSPQARPGVLHLKECIAVSHATGQHFCQCSAEVMAGQHCASRADCALMAGLCPYKCKASAELGQQARDLGRGTFRLLAQSRQLCRLAFHSGWAFQLQWWQKWPPHLHRHGELVSFSPTQDSFIV